MDPFPHEQVSPASALCCWHGMLWHAAAATSLVDRPRSPALPSLLQHHPLQRQAEALAPHQAGPLRMLAQPVLSLD